MLLYLQLYLNRWCIMMNTYLIKTTDEFDYRVDELLKHIKVCPCTTARDELIELGVDPNGVQIGQMQANKIWHMIVPDAA